MPTGVLKAWFKEKGFGFIAPDAGDSDVFAHARQLNGMDPNSIADGRQENTRVTYDTEWDAAKGKPKASNWSITSGGPPMGGCGPPMGGCGGPPQQQFGQPQPHFGGPPQQQFGGFPGQMPQGPGMPMQQFGAPQPGFGQFGPQGGPPQQQQHFQPYGGGGGCGGPPQNFGGSPAGCGCGGPAPLPPGWEQIPDPSSGKAYFCNRATGETRWDPPPQQAMAPAPVPAPVPAPMPQAGPALPPGWEQITDPSTGKAYFCNRTTNETRWDPPPAAAAAPAPAPAPVPVPAAAPAPQAGTQLPPGWEQITDPSTGKAYFCNRTTNETRWDPPVAAATPAPQQQAEPAPAQQAAPVEQAPAPQAAAPQQAGGASLPPGWEQAGDPAGKPYFFNRATGETRWDPPV